MNENEKKIIFYIESMRDGCTRETLYNYLDRQLVESIIKDFLDKNYIYEASEMIFINYEKIEINPWIEVIVK